MQLDIKVLNFFHQFQNSSLDRFFSFITWFGSLWTLVPFFIFTILILAKNGMQSLILPLSAGFLGAVGTTYSLKYLLNRQRPYIHQAVTQMPQDPSFPSAHTAQIFSFVFLLILILFHNETAGRYFISSFLVLAAALVASSRIYLQVHYFSDIIAGIFVALLWTYVAYFLINS